MKTKCLIQFSKRQLFGLTLFISALGPLHGAEKTAQEPGLTTIFDGKSLAGWSGDPKVWTIKGGVLTGHVPQGFERFPEQYLIYTNTPQLGDFEVRFTFRLLRGNAGVLYRAQRIGDTKIKAYEYSQLDKTFRNGDTGTIHETGPTEAPGRNRLANLGLKVIIESTGKIVKDGETAAAPNEIRAKAFCGEGWQEGAIIAQGKTLTHWLNGDAIAEATDQEPTRRRVSGLLVLRVIGSMNDTLVEFKSIRLRKM